MTSVLDIDPGVTNPAAGDYQPAITGLVSFPIASTSTVTSSPGFSHSGGVRKVPQPAGVPVESTSPGSSVMYRLQYSISVATGNSISSVEASWRSAPLT